MNPNGTAVRAADRFTAIPYQTGQDPIVRNSAIVLFGKLIPLATGVVAIPVVVHKLGVPRFGVLSVIWVLVNVFGLLDFAIASGVTQFVAQCRTGERRRRIAGVVWTAFTLELAAAAIGCAAFYLAIPYLMTGVLRVPAAMTAEAQAALYALVPIIPAMVPCGALGSVLEGHERFDLVNVIQIPAGSATFAVALIGALLGWRLPSIVTALVVCRYLVIAAYGRCALIIVPELFRRPVVQWATVKFLLRFGGWVGSAQVLRRVIISLDRFFIARFAGLDAVAYYSVPIELLQRLGFLSSSIGTASLPAFAKLKDANDELLSRSFDRTLSLLTVVLGLVLGSTAVFAPAILDLWIGHRFATHGGEVMRVLAGAMFFAWISVSPITFFRAIGRPEIPTKVRLLVTPGEIVALFLATRSYGAMGAATVLALGHAVSAVLLFWLCRSLYNLPSNSELRRLGKFGVALGCCLAAATLIYGSSMLPVFAKVAGVSMVFVALWGIIWQWRLAEQEIALAYGLLREVSSIPARFFAFCAGPSGR